MESSLRSLFRSSSSSGIVPSLNFFQRVRFFDNTNPCVFQQPKTGTVVQVSNLITPFYPVRWLRNTRHNYTRAGRVARHTPIEPEFDDYMFDPEDLTQNKRRLERIRTRKRDPTAAAKVAEE